MIVISLSVIDIRSAGYGIVPKLVMLDRSISVGAKGLYAYLSSYAGRDNECYPTRSKICYDLKICSSVMSRCIKELTDAGYICKTQVRSGGKFTNNLYKLTQTVACGGEGDTASDAAADDCTVHGNPAVGKTVNGVTNTTINSNTITNNNIKNNKNTNDKINSCTSDNTKFRFLEPEEDFFASIM